MAYFKESEQLIYQTSTFTVHSAMFDAISTHGHNTPNPKAIVRFGGGVEISVSARSEHKARQIALDIGELFSQ